MIGDGATHFIEIRALDFAAAKQFYDAVFDWRFVEYGPGYVAFEWDGCAGGFNANRKIVTEGRAILVLYANELGAVEAKVQTAGAQIVSRKSFEGGRRFHFRDPNGNGVAFGRRPEQQSKQAVGDPRAAMQQ